MAKQLTLWPMKENSSQTLDIWQSLNHEQQNQVITTIAQLIHKIVCPEIEKQAKEVDDEQQ